MIQPQYLSYGYDSFHHCPSTSPIDTTQFTTAPILALRIRYSTLQPQFQFCWCTLLSHCQSYWYYTVHFCPSTSLTDMVQSTNSPTSPNDTTQSMSVAVLVLLIWYSLPLPSTSPTDTTAHFYLNISPADMKQSTIAPLQDILIRYLYQSYWYLTDTSSSDIQQSTTALILVLSIPYNPQLPRYMSYWYDTIHYCPSTSPT